MSASKKRIKGHQHLSEHPNDVDLSKLAALDSLQKPNTFSADALSVIDSNTYQITDLHLKDFYGDIKETISKTVLYPTMKTRGHIHPLKGEIYHFTNGFGIMFMQTKTDNRVYLVEAESYIYVPKETWHLVINLGKNENLEFYTIYHGPSERPSFKRDDYEKSQTVESGEIPPVNFIPDDNGYNRKKLRKK